MVDFAPPAVDRRARDPLDRRHGARAARGGRAGARGERLHRLARDPRRAGEDAAPARPRRHPRPADAGAPGGDADRPASTPIDLVVVNLYPFRETVAARRAVRRGDREHRHRRPGDDALGGQEPRARGGGRRPGRLRARCSPRSTPTARSRRRPALRAGPQGVRPHRRLRRRHRLAPAAGCRRPRRRWPTFPRRCVHLRDAGARAALRREPAPEGGLLRRSTARRARRWRAPRCCRARSCRTTTCSISTRRCGCAREFAEPAAAIIKHNNPCGVAVGRRRRRRGLPPGARDRSGVGLRRHRGGQPRGRRRLARELAETFLECVIAPAFAPEALAAAGGQEEPAPAGLPIGRRRRRRRCRAAQRGAAACWCRRATRDTAAAADAQGRHQAAADRRTSCATSTSPGGSASTSSRTPSCSPPAARTVGVGAGQMRRVDSVRIAVAQGARCRWPGSVVASDAFFPFRDGVDEAAKAGALAVVQPGGSVRDDEVDRRRRRARHGDGLHRRAPLPALDARAAIFLVGSGGREHALAWKIAASPLCERLVVAPGQPGHRRRAEGRAACRSPPTTSPELVAAGGAPSALDLVVCGPEAALVRRPGRRHARGGHAVLRALARGGGDRGLEGLRQAPDGGGRRPDRRLRRVRRGRRGRGVHRSLSRGDRWWSRPTGWRAGKGVVVAVDKAEAKAAVRRMLAERPFGAAGARVVIEERLAGREVSMMALVRRRAAGAAGLVRGPQGGARRRPGPNTGGMGTYSPSPLVDAALGAAHRRDAVRADGARRWRRPGGRSAAALRRPDADARSRADGDRMELPLRRSRDAGRC